MSNLTLIVLTRAIHVMASVAWAGAVFMLAGVLVPIARRDGTEMGRLVGVVAQRVGAVIVGSAALAVVSGIYLFVALHRHDESAGGVVLGAGALAGLLSLAIGAFVSRPVARAAGRATGGVRLMAALLALAVLAMATFRYASAVI